MDTRNGKQMMGDRLKHYMEKAELSVPKLESILEAKPRRSYIYKILEGTANFSINIYEKLLKTCNNVTLAECLRSLRDESGIPPDCADLYEKLDAIVAAKHLGEEFARQVEGIRVNLEAIELTVRLMKDRLEPHHPNEKSQKKTRAQPSPTQGEGDGTQGWDGARTAPRKHDKRKRAK
jgi:hypothetical protein